MLIVDFQIKNAQKNVLKKLKIREPEKKSAFSFCAICAHINFFETIFIENRSMKLGLSNDVSMMSL